MPRTLRRRRRRALLLAIALQQTLALLPSLPVHRARRRHATPIADDFCVLPPDDADISATLDDLLTETRGFDLALRAAPIVAPGFAFIAYPYVAAAFRAVFELIKNAPYVEVDGGQYEINILTPTLIGIVMPSLSISFGTLVATTVNTLRQRQLDLRVLLNQELSAVQLLRVGLDANFRGATTMNAREADARAALLLEGYVARVIQESSGRSRAAASVLRVYACEIYATAAPSTRSCQTQVRGERLRAEQRARRALLPLVGDRRRRVVDLPEQPPRVGGDAVGTTER